MNDAAPPNTIVLPYLRFGYLEWHHLYTGVIIAVAGFVFDVEAVRWIGAVIATDDVGQHICQGYAMIGQSYVSPLHFIFYKLFPAAP